MNIVKTGESILLTLGVMLISLIALYGLMSLIVKFSPQPISGLFSNLARKSSPDGWVFGESNS